MLYQRQTTTNLSDPIIGSTAAHLTEEALHTRLTDYGLRRLATVKHYEILDGPPEAEFDRITALAAELFDAPVSIIGFVDHDRIWIKSHHGLGVALADHWPILRSIETGLQTDSKTGIRSLTSLAFAGDDGLRFCVSAPLCANDGYEIGTLCVIDRAAIMLDERRLSQLKILSAIVVDHLERRLSARRMMAEAMTMASETDHRVLNSLQLISSLLNKQSRIAHSPEAVDQLAIAAKRVLAIARLNHRLTADESGSDVPVLDYLCRECAELSEVLGTEISVSGVRTIVPSTQVLAIGLITHELVMNARKHGAGAIAVAFAPDNAGTNKLSVTDEGEGLAPDFTLERAGEGLGLKIVRTLVAQLNGKLDACPNPSGRGARFTMTFPAA